MEPPMDITKDIRSLTEFKRDTSRFVARLKDTGRPSVLTVNGRPELVVMAAKTWQETQDQAEFARTVAGIRKGLKQADTGRTLPARTFFRKAFSRKIRRAKG
jgi:prevent-host-death family protein